MLPIFRNNILMLLLVGLHKLIGRHLYLELPPSCCKVFNSDKGKSNLHSEIAPAIHGSCRGYELRNALLRIADANGTRAMPLNISALGKFRRSNKVYY